MNKIKHESGGGGVSTTEQKQGISFYSFQTWISGFAYLSFKGERSINHLLDGFRGNKIDKKWNLCSIQNVN